MTTSNRVSVPDRLPSAPAEYDQNYMDRLVGLIDQHFSAINSRKRVLATTVNISDLPTTSTGLRSGELWNDSGTVKIIS